MKITDNISANLSAWMAASPGLNTIGKLSSRAKVGFGTVRRIKNGEGNPTITNLCEIADVFGKQVQDLLAEPAKSENVVKLVVEEPKALYGDPIWSELLDIFRSMDEKGKWQLLGAAKQLAIQYPKQKNTNGSN